MNYTKTEKAELRREFECGDEEEKDCFTLIKKRRGY